LTPDGHHVQAHKEVRESAPWARALQCALALGNFLNHGSRLGSAFGVRLRSLAKMQVRTHKLSFKIVYSNTLPLKRHFQWNL